MREVEIAEHVDQWYGPDYCYFKVKGNDSNLYILRFDEGRGADDVPEPTSRFRSACCACGPRSRLIGQRPFES
jgi:hypothetical protein